mgnify:CR=1 FL=1
MRKILLSLALILLMPIINARGGGAVAPSNVFDISSFYWDELTPNYSKLIEIKNQLVCILIE